MSTTTGNLAVAIDAAEQVVADLEARRAAVETDVRKLKNERSGLAFLAKAKGDSKAQKRIDEIVDILARKVDESRDFDDALAPAREKVARLKVEEEAAERRALEAEHKKLRQRLKEIGALLEQCEFTKNTLLSEVKRLAEEIGFPNPLQLIGGLRRAETVATQRRVGVGLPLGAVYQFDLIGAGQRAAWTYDHLLSEWAADRPLPAPAPVIPPKPPEAIAAEVARARQVVGSKAWCKSQAWVPGPEGAEVVQPVDKAQSAAAAIFAPDPGSRAVMKGKTNGRS